MPPSYGGPIDQLLASGEEIESPDVVNALLVSMLRGGPTTPDWAAARP